MRCFVVFVWLTIITVKGTAQVTYVDSLTNLLKNERDISHRIEILSEISREQLRISHVQALENITLLKKLSDSTNNKRGLAHYYRLMAGLNSIQGNHLNSTSFVFQAIKLYEQLGDTTGVANSYVAMANNYTRQKLYAQAVQYQTMAYLLFTKLKNKRRIIVALTNLTFLYNNLGKYDSALIIGNQSIELSKEEKYHSVIINDYKNLGYSYYYKKQYKDAIENFEKAIQLDNSLGGQINTEAITETLIGIGRANIESGSKNIGYNFLVQSAEKAAKHGLLTWLRDSYALLSGYYEKDGNYKISLRYLSQHLAVVDSLAQIQRDEREKFGDIYLNAFKESYQNDLLLKEGALNEKIVEQQRLQIIFGGISILVLLSLLYFLKRNYNRRKETNTILNKQKGEIEGKNVQLEKLIKTKDKFFSIVAHDLRSPLNSLKSFTSLIRKHAGMLTKEEIIEMSKELDSTINNTIKMTESLLTWAQQQMQTVESNPEKIEVAPLANQVADLYKEAAEKKSITIHIEVELDATVYVDKNHFMFIIRNLVNNAVKFTPTGGQIKIKAEDSEGKTQISVRDTGIGMTKEKLLKLFEINKTQKTYGTAGEKGTGLGLILVKEFALQNSGEIKVESEPGKGSTFFVTLPQG
jgi:signal transduction histidine kinase